MTRRTLYLSNTPVEEALDLYINELGDGLKVSYEMIPVTESLGRVTKEAIMAKYCSPLFNASAMDGIAVVSERTHGASEVNPVTLVEGEDYIVVDTGDPVNAPYDGVIMVENIIEKEPGKVEIIAPISAWNHVRPIGEDIVAGEMLLPGRHKIRPMDIGVLLSAGILEIEVVKKPKVAIFPTGTELIEPTETPIEGSIIESNSRMFENLVVEQGGLAQRMPIIKDDYDDIRNKIAESIKDNDLVIINAGSSAGREDYTVHVLEELGKVVIHGVAIKPGKPLILAIVEGKPVIGLPGYPVSAYIDYDYFVRPLIEIFLGEKKKDSKEMEAIISKRMISSLKHREYVRVKLGKVDGKMVASPLARGAGAAMSLTRADGFCVIDQNSEGVEAGDIVKVIPYKNLNDIEHTLVSIGSHDLILDVISDMMASSDGDSLLSSTHIGSMGGLMALRRGETHIAPIHLLDGETGEYNISYIKKLFNEPMSIIKGVKRTQGLMVKKGNPLGINILSDFTKVRFVNRQRGAGTRVLLDYLLKKEGIDPVEIKGYDFEASTHMAVAAMVNSPNADAGMGIYSAAKSMGLDFIEISEEEYDFAIPTWYLELPFVKEFIRILGSDEFKQRIANLGGYKTENSGLVISNIV